jgi:hypothetical protein
MMLSASLPSVEAYDAFNLSPMTVVARILPRQGYGWENYTVSHERLLNLIQLHSCVE